MKKQLKKMLDAAKAAWDKAVTDKSAKEIIAKLKLKHETLHKSWEQAEDDEPEIELGDKSAANTYKAGETEEVTLDEIGELVAKSVETTLKVQLPDALKGQVTEEGIKKIVYDALKDSEAAKLKPDQIKTAVEEIVTKAMATIKRPSKMQFDAQDGHRDNDGGQVEITLGWRKGNLPVHAKQLLNRMLNKHQDDGIDNKDIEASVKAGIKTLDQYQVMAQMGKALTQSTNGDLYPLDLSSELQRRLFLASNLAAILAAQEIDMPSQPYDLPLVTTRPVFYLNNTQRSSVGADGSVPGASTPGTARPRLDAQRLIAQVNYSYEADEDSIIPVLNMVQTLLAEAAAAAYESAAINGDTTATHMDSDTAAISGAAEKAWKGFRFYALAQTQTKSSGALSGIAQDTTAGLSPGASAIIGIKKLMGKYGIRIADLMWICGPKAVNDLITFNQVATLEKFGPKATILTGEIAALFGIPIVVSEQNRENLNAAGVFDNVTTTKGSLLLVNKSQWLAGRRREFIIETFRNVQTQDNNIVASFRKAMTPLEVPSATVPSTTILVNYTA